MSKKLYYVAAINKRFFYRQMCPKDIKWKIPLKRPWNYRQKWDKLVFEKLDSCLCKTNSKLIQRYFLKDLWHLIKWQLIIWSLLNKSQNL